MARGKIKWFDDKKGFGFIEVKGEKDVFVHYSAIEGQEGYKSLEKDDEVEFELGDSEKGPQAKSVRKV